MANKARGYVTLSIGPKIERQVTLGLGALAELEDAFGVDSFEEALNFGERVSAKKMHLFLQALLKGNRIEITPEIAQYVDGMPIDEFLGLINDLTAAAGMKAEPAEQAKGGERPLAAANAGKRG